MEYLNDHPDVAGFTGTENYYRLPFGMVCTDGAKAVFDKFSCWWVSDIIISYQTKKKVKDISIQFWEVRLNIDKNNKKIDDGCEVFCVEDKDMPKIISQIVPYTDIPGNLKLYVQYSQDSNGNKFGVIFLPSEY